jgi:hypothetical protein
VLFGWGDDWWVSWPRYRADQDSFPTGITDTSACYDDVTDILTALADGDSSQGIEAMTSDDIFFCWTFDHGGPLYPDSMYVYLCLMDGVIWDTTFARYANPIQCQRRTFWMQQCHSGGFKDDLGDSSTVFISACDWDEVAYRADDKDTSGNPVDEHEVYNDTAYHHGEFDYHVMNAVRGETPNGDPIDADIDGDGLISMDEVWNWEYYHDSWYRYIHYPTPQYVDLGNLGSETYLNTGEVVSGHITSNTTWESDATIYVRGDVVVDSGVTLTIEDGATVIFSTDFDSEKSGADTSSCELIVYGTLYAWGTASDSIVFTSNASSPSQGDWYGIVQKNSSSNSSKIDHCQIKYAHKGFSCYKCSADVRMTTFNNCDYGAYVDTAATKLFLYRVTCTNCSYGLRVQEGKAWLLDNNFTHNDIGIGYFSAKHYFPGGPSRNADIKGCDVKYNTKGIFVDDCSPIINHCFIDSNSLWGIKCTGDSDPILGRDTLMYNGVGSKAMNMPGPTKSNPPPQEHKGGLSCLGTSCPIVCTGAVSGPYVRGRNVIKDNNGRGV